jgi:ABC-type multidrug transport system ATPase subunit
MKQRIAIARSLLHEPRILFLDEPSRSLDPTATDRLHQLLRRLVTQQGVTVFLITHDLAEAEKLCGRVAIMHQGEIRAIDEPGALRSSLDQRVSYTVHVGGLSLAAEKAVRAVTPGVSVEVSGPLTQLGFRTTDDETELTEVLGRLLQYGATIHRIDGSPLPLDQVFRQLTSDAIDEETD